MKVSQPFCTKQHFDMSQSPMLQVLLCLLTVPDNNPRKFPCVHADVTIGSWLLALNSTHFDDRRLCETSCTGTAVGVYDFPKCAGLCNPVKSLRDLHADPACLTFSESELDRLPGFFDFPGN